ncbi:hypothetical protein [Paenibacillus borealis]|uniref:Uncharacterized protein n=1 Tax=Paenibacillus borealis TaxID=160799 RepID=A0A089LAP8_PAEBO|nr:hypothetical protein [Paenibacillus borealis]AIQ57180.1 hypothetical protein PBOR_09745 [Paenibacillus borealis]
MKFETVGAAETVFIYGYLPPTSLWIKKLVDSGGRKSKFSLQWRLFVSLKVLCSIYIVRAGEKSQLNTSEINYDEIQRPVITVASASSTLEA